MKILLSIFFALLLLISYKIPYVTIITRRLLATLGLIPETEADGNDIPIQDHVIILNAAAHKAGELFHNCLAKTKFEFEISRELAR